jgi:2-polyprenyl-6-methoxyphenol hydroxylase-like FAD-dependent oxidoreductase
MHDVIIVGAGPVGMVAALRLEEAGADVLVLERDNQLTRDLRASTFHPPTLDMLAACGVTKVLLDNGLVCPNWQIRLHESGDRAVFDLGVLSDETDHPFRLQCEQSVLTHHLAARLADSAHVEIRTGQRVIDAGQDARHAWVLCEHPGESEQLSARYIIGADGADSCVRRAMGVAFDGVTYPDVSVLATTPFDFQSVLTGLSNVSYCWREGGNFALLRLQGVWRASLYYDPSMTPEQAASNTEVQRQLQAIHPRNEHYEILDRRPYRVHQRLADNYRVGRLMLAGDAAHINSPTGGMGMNGGIHDAINLVAKLVSVLAGDDDELLNLYTRQRRTVAEQDILAQADRNRARMRQTDPKARQSSLDDLKAIAADATRARGFLRRSSMLNGLELAASIT